MADIRRYIKLGPLGQAFAAMERQVLLIDEIDKADLIGFERVRRLSRDARRLG